MFLAFQVVAYVFIAIRCPVYPSSIPDIIFPLSCIYCPIRVFVCAFAIYFVILPLACIAMLLVPEIGALAFEVAIPEVTFVFLPFIEYAYPFTMWY